MQGMQDLERLKTIHNGPKSEPTFSRAEMERRNNTLRKYMGENGIEAVLFTSIHNINYYSDFLHTRFARNYGLVVTPRTHVTVSANIDGGMPWRRSFGDNLVYTDWRRDNYFFALQTLLADAGLKKGKLGIEFDDVNILLKKQLEDALPNFELVDVSQDVMKFRMRKSREEVEHIKNGARVCDIGGYAAKEAIAAGVPEFEVALAGTQAMTREIAKLYPQCDLRDIWVWFQSGLNTDGAHNWATGKKVEKGDILSLNAFSVIAGYYTALERTMFCGDADEASLRYWNINVEVHKRGLELIRPGAKCQDICFELNDIYRKYDLLPNRTFGYGHSFGVLCHYYGREMGLELREDIETILEPGMVISMEPMIMIPEGKPGAGGYREHDILVIDENGEVENITKFPFGPEHNIIK